MKVSKINIISLCATVALTMAVFAPDALAQAQKPAQAQMQGRITRSDGQQFTGLIRYVPTGRKYIVTQSRKDGTAIATDINLSEVAKVETAKPAKLDAAINAVQAGNSKAAIPVLEQIVTQYAFLGWDEPAARYLAKAKINVGQPEDAIKLCEGIIKAKPKAAYIGEIAPIYWEALLKTDKKAKLQELIAKAIATGDRAASASALIMRGDILMEQKETLNALKDGYLRVVILYENVRQVQPEALFKAAKAFEALSQTSNAEKLRDVLRTKYAKSEWTAKL